MVDGNLSMANKVEVDEPELLPCPFCGEEAELEFEFVGKDEKTMRFIQCSKCLSRTDYFNEDSVEQASKAWNTRVPTEIEEDKKISGFKMVNGEYKWIIYQGIEFVPTLRERGES